MPVKLLPHVRLLNSSLPVTRFSLMNPNPTALKHCRVIPIFTGVFPHKLKYQAIARRLRFPNLSAQNPEPQLGVRGFSTRSARPRPGSEVMASKSLIEDEAELSDWVSGLRSKSNSFSTRLYSDDDDNGDSSRGSDRRRGRDERGGRGGVSSVKRRRESDSDDYSSPSRGRGGVSSRGRGNRESFPRNSMRNGRFGGASDVKNDGFMSRRRENGSNDFSVSRRGRGARGSFNSVSRNLRGNGHFAGEKDDRFVSRRREDGSNDFSVSRRGRGAGGSFNSVSRNLRGNGRFAGENDRFVSQRREDDMRGGRSSTMVRRDEKGMEYGRDRDSDRGGGRFMNGGKGMGRRGLVLSDEDNVVNEDEGGEEKLMDSLRELISEEVDEDDDVIMNGSRLSRLDIEDSQQNSCGSSAVGSDSYLSETRFDQCSVSPLSLKAIKDAGYEKLTVVQEATLPVILKGKDVLAKAKTGTGKTVAFLLPSIEVVAKSPPEGRDQKCPPILVLVICPTRELASQAAAEANTLLKYHASIGVQVVIGGTRLALEQKRMQANPCQILVATPGRLKDHIENTAGFATRLMGVKVLVLDEADHLLDMGFRKDIEKIIAAVPKQRQTLLFSATVPQEVRQICHIALKGDHEFINTVQEGSEETHAQVRQTHLIAHLEKQFPLLYVLLKEHIADDIDYKVLVFCTTAMVTRLVADLFGQLNLNVREIHSRKPQSYRTRVSDEFRKSKGLILVTSDVSARGVDYPDVTLVIQVGLPADKEQYIHRLGRTGRKGKEGQGILLLTPWEEFFLSSLKDLPVSKAPLPLVDPDTKKKVENALSHVEMKNKEAAYQAWLGYYNSNKTVGRDKCGLVELANEFSRSMGLDNPPAISKLVLGKMGLRNVPGLLSK